MAISVLARGSGTLLKSAPGVIASLDVTATGAAATDTVVITSVEALPQDGAGLHSIYGYADTNKVVVKSSRAELPEDVTFNYVVFTGSA
jgi:predicted TIM-barrel enzyme